MQSAHKDKRTLILAVSDSPVILSTLHVMLGNEYDLLKAESGEEAFSLSLNHAPDMIIAGMTTRETDGYTLLKSIRAHQSLGHLPLVMLVEALPGENKQRGYKMGVDAYLHMPLKEDELLLRVEGILENRRRTIAFARRSFESDNGRGPAVEKAFMLRLDGTIEKHLSDVNLKVTQLADEMAVSVSTLERKLKHLVNTTPKLYIRDYRLLRAMQLLRQRRGNVKEIALSCGFDNNSYFTFCFREKYKMLPSELLGNKVPRTLRSHS